MKVNIIHILSRYIRVAESGGVDPDPVPTVKRKPDPDQTLEKQLTPRKC